MGKDYLDQELQNDQGLATDLVECIGDCSDDSWHKNGRVGVEHSWVVPGQ